MSVVVDIELTNRCNAKCHFCPRDQTPHQGLMKEEVFDKALERAIEAREVAAALGSEMKVSLCGLGEPLLHPKAAEFVRRVKAAGFEVHMASNGSLLDERRGRALIEAGLDQININVGDEGGEYEEVYRLPFEKTRDNVLRFAETAAGKCIVNVVLVDHRADEEHIARMKKYWRSYGIESFTTFEVMNRGGALFIDHMQFDTYEELTQARAMFSKRGASALCITPFIFMFIGYDGNYYLCCSDWKKEAPLGNVFDYSLNDITRQKLEHVTSRDPICKSCNWDPLNHLTEKLREVNVGERDPSTIDAIFDDIAVTSASILDAIARTETLLGERGVSGRRRIPVTGA